MLYPSLLEGRTKQEKKLAILIDPDNISNEELLRVVDMSVVSGVDYLFVGGSLMVTDQLDNFIRLIKANCDIPVIIFPGSILQISSQADAILLLSLISGRNPEMLIGNHVLAAPYLKGSGLEILSTGYMLVDGGRPTTVSYMSNSTPLPHDKPDIAVSTAMAGEMLGLKLIYLDSGSGALQTVSPKMIAKVRANVDLPIIVGGGIRTPEMATEICKAGADLIVVGNAVEKDLGVIREMCSSVKALTNAAHRHFQG